VKLSSVFFFFFSVSENKDSVDEVRISSTTIIIPEMLMTNEGTKDGEVATSVTEESHLGEQEVEVRNSDSVEELNVQELQTECLGKSYFFSKVTSK